MLTTDFVNQYRNRLIVGGSIGVIVVGLTLRMWYSTPQLGVSEDVYKTVDALFTAVNSRDEKRLADCEQRLHDHHNEGQLPGAAARKLDGLIEQARSGQWEPTARTLYNFMLAQRRTH